MYSSELVALCIAVEAILGIRFKLRAMGLKIEDTTTILCNNKSVVLNMQLPSSLLKKKHNLVAFHKACEAVAAGIVGLGHVDSMENASDILTKSLGPSDYYRLTEPILFNSFKILFEGSRKLVQANSYLRQCNQVYGN